MKSSSFNFPSNQANRESWWIRIQTEGPLCTYYFGPFDTEQEAEQTQWGYFEDLFLEDAKNVTAHIEKVCPRELTVYKSQ